MAIIAFFAIAYLALIGFAKSDAAKEWFNLIASRSLETQVIVDRLSLSSPWSLVAYDVRSHSMQLKSLSMEFNLGELLGPTQTITGRGELIDGWAFDYKFRGSVWTEELRSLSIRIDQWPLPELMRKLRLSKYMLAPVEAGSIRGILVKRRRAWEFKGTVQRVQINLSRIATGSQLPRAFPERSKLIVKPLHLRYAPNEVQFLRPLQVKSRMGTLILNGALKKTRTWHWRAHAVVKDAKVARAAYGYLLRCRPLPLADVFKVIGPIQNPQCQ